MASHLFVIAVSMVLSAACRSDSRAVLESDPAVAAGRRATVSMIYSPAHSSLHSGVSARVTYWLELTRPGGEHKGELEHFFEEDPMSSGALDVSSAEFAAMRSTKPRVQIASDAHALAVSRDGGSLYRYVALDAGDKPLYCRHLAFATDASGDVWGAAPTTRALVLGILRSGSGTSPSPHFVSSDSNPFDLEFEEGELSGALTFACAGSDADLRRAVVQAVLPGTPMSSTDIEEALLACVAEIAKSDASAKAALVAEVAAKKPALQTPMARAARALAATSDATAQEALADALRTAPGEGHGCPTRAALAWSLASVTANRGQASKAVLAVLAKIARERGPCPDETGGEMARMYAVRGLAAVAAGAPDLRALARPACAAPLDSWPDKFERWNEASEFGIRDVACWARAALERSAGAKPPGK